MTVTLQHINPSSLLQADLLEALDAEIAAHPVEGFSTSDSRGGGPNSFTVPISFKQGRRGTQTKAQQAKREQEAQAREEEREKREREVERARQEERERQACKRRELECVFQVTISITLEHHSHYSLTLRLLLSNWRETCTTTRITL
jgi:hypothetical protein